MRAEEQARQATGSGAFPLRVGRSGNVRPAGGENHRIPLRAGASRLFDVVDGFHADERETGVHHFADEMVTGEPPVLR